jgi:hypothetical protein
MVALECVVELERRQGQVHEAGGAGSGGPAAREPAARSETNSGQRSVVDLEPAAPAWPPWRMKSDEHASRVGAEVQPTVAPARSPDHISQLGPDDRRGRWSSTSRDATSPTIPTGHGPRTIVAAIRRPARRARRRDRGRASPIA